MRIEGVKAPAKLNLFLHVTGVRNDGYHLLQSVFVRIDWQDTLDFWVRTDSAAITREDVTVPLPAQDLTVRAARALQQAGGVALGAHIRVDKSIPSEAGLGGGSSDAAATLLALNRLWRLDWPLERLLPLAASLGADVPFFLVGSNAWVEGVGEQITPLQERVTLPPTRFVVVKPQQGAATAEIFRHPLLNRSHQSATISGFAADPFGFGGNDLQMAAEQICPDVKKAIFLLKAAGFRGRMTGSGSAVFAVLGQEDCGLQLQRLSASLPDGWVMRVCNLLL
ncbi:4-diphosphocytidyl-2C-methyl-D-erythritol kinase [Lampropedia cohaerens]|uniref:4-diphosphocytidyl-2-C-methyl-D-erythritol kinase n=2 Tax=Lampropedia cohaerens TaxID=1610491 RepID=A0A0U1PYN5_9BURK|nr:4-diphosphocytidyl-2C-methyl-D-erythritol kinase [Lampropedia cohaerens]